MVVVDTSILVESLRLGTYSPVLLDLSDRLTSRDIIISAIAIQELYVGDSTRNPKVIKAIDNLVRAFTVLDFTEDHAKLAGSLMLQARQMGRTVTFADASLAGVAISLNAELATLNSKHFAGLPGLKLYDISKHKRQQG